MTRSILIATGNPDKLREIVVVMGDLSVDWKLLDDFGDLPDVEEDADTFMGNAEKKALHYAALTGAWALADDSGLEVDALDGAPGVYSARYAGCEAKSYAANNAKLIRELAGVPDEQRTARFRCAMVLTDGTEVLLRGEGAIEGRIIDEARGHNGFGYDPHFFLPQYGKTQAEIEPDLKNRISHRARALQAIRRGLTRLLVS